MKLKLNEKELTNLAYAITITTDARYITEEDLTEWEELHKKIIIAIGKETLKKIKKMEEKK